MSSRPVHTPTAALRGAIGAGGMSIVSPVAGSYVQPSPRPLLASNMDASPLQTRYCAPFQDVTARLRLERVAGKVVGVAVVGAGPEPPVVETCGRS